MKKRLLLFAILFFGLCGCDKDNGEDVDPPGIGHFVWVNASDHRITMTVNGQFEDEIMLPGERISKTMIGFIALPPSPDLYVMHGIEIVFDDGPYGGVFTRPKEYPAAPYNPCNEKEYVCMGGYAGGKRFVPLGLDLHFHQCRLRCGRSSRADDGAVAFC